MGIIRILDPMAYVVFSHGYGAINSDLLTH